MRLSTSLFVYNLDIHVFIFSKYIYSYINCITIYWLVLYSYKIAINHINMNSQLSLTQYSRLLGGVRSMLAVLLQDDLIYTRICLHYHKNILCISLQS